MWDKMGVGAMPTASTATTWPSERPHMSALSQPSPGPARTDLVSKITTAVDLLGVYLDSPTHSKRHGYRPDARLHVERYFLRTILGMRVVDIAKQDNLAKSTIYSSIAVGRRLVRANAKALGITPDLFGVAPRPRTEFDDDDNY